MSATVLSTGQTTGKFDAQRDIPARASDPWTLPILLEDGTGRGSEVRWLGGGGERRDVFLAGRDLCVSGECISGVVGVLVSTWAVALISMSGRETEIQLLYEKAASCFVY